MIQNNEDKKIKVSSNTQTHILKYSEILYNTKQENPDTVVVAKYFNCEIEIESTDTKEMIVDKIFLNLYQNMETIKKKYPEIIANLYKEKKNPIALFFYKLAVIFDK